MVQQKMSLEDDLIQSNEALKEEMKEIDVRDIWMAYAIPPSDSFIQSVRRHGVVKPIIVAPNAHGESYPYRVIDGRRRLTAARIVGYEKIKAVVRMYEKSSAALLVSLAANEQRSDNPIATYRALQELVQRGYMLEEIAQITGIASDRILRLLMLSNAGDEVLDGVEKGTVALGTALAVAKLSEAQRSKARKKFFETGKLTGRDVVEARQAEVGAAVETVSELLKESLDEVFGGMEEYDDGKVEVDVVRLPADLVGVAKSVMIENGMTYEEFQERAWRLAVDDLQSKKGKKDDQR